MLYEKFMDVNICDLMKDYGKNYIEKTWLRNNFIGEPGIWINLTQKIHDFRIIIWDVYNAMSNNFILVW